MSSQSKPLPMLAAARRFLIILLLMTSTLPILAATTPEKYKFCVVCHGSHFQGNASTDAPNLSILTPWYIELALMGYKYQTRGGLEADAIGREMQPMVSTLGANEILEVAAFIGALDDQAVRPTVTGNISRGKRLYESCATCHGADGLGNEMLRAPRLVGQFDWYLIRQLKAYLQNLRGVSKRDPYGTQMRGAVQTLPDASAVTDVVAYINTL